MASDGPFDCIDTSFFTLAFFLLDVLVVYFKTEAGWRGGVADAKEYYRFCNAVIVEIDDLQAHNTFRCSML